MKRMLVNATQEEELRVAMVDGQKLFDLDIDIPSQAQKKANIYKGKITRIEPSLDAVFVNYGAERHGFLPLKEISSEYFVQAPESGERVNIREVLKEGQPIIVQVEKEERGNKGAALTTFISLAGRFIVLMPNNPRAGGVSRRITGEDRDLVRDALAALELPENMGVIIRTAGVGRSHEELKWDLEYLLGIWGALYKAAEPSPAPALLYQDSNAIVRALRDHLSSDVGEILVDDVQAHNEARDFMRHAMPHNERKLKLYEDPVPLFTRYQIESQIESAFAHNVQLPSGGSIVIDHTEALVSIDINSARATKGGDIEATALATNLEAADEIARQCRLRDLGGLLVIDFIDMGPQRNQREVENRMHEAVKRDRARVQLGRISRFGLLELSRQRLRPSLGESAHEVCPRCNGLGRVRSVESLALAILRLVGEEARKERTAKVIAQLPVDVATYLLNEKRDWISRIENRESVQVVLVASPDLETPNYSIRRVRDDHTVLPENTGASYTLAADTEDAQDPALEAAARSRPKAETPVVQVVMPDTPAPPPAPAAPPAAVAKPGLFVRFWRALFGTGDEQPSGNDERKRRAKRSNQSQGRRGQSASGRQRQRNDSRGRTQRGQGRGRNDRTRGDESGKSGEKAAAEGQKRGKQQGEGKARGSETAERGQQARGDGQKPRRNRRRRRSGGNSRPSGDNGQRKEQGKSRAPEKLQESGKTGADVTQQSSGGESGTAPPRAPAPEQSAARSSQSTPPAGAGPAPVTPTPPAAKASPDTYTVWSSGPAQTPQGRDDRRE